MLNWEMVEVLDTEKGLEVIHRLKAHHSEIGLLDGMEEGSMPPPKAS